MGIVAAPTLGPPSTHRFAVKVAGSYNRDLLVEGYWRPVIALGDAALRGRAMDYRVREKLPGVAPKPVTTASLNVIDMERVNLAALRTGLAALEPAPDPAHPPILILPISWTAARGERTRRDLARIAGQARTIFNTIPIAEIHDLETGAPSDLLIQTNASLIPIFGGVLARLAGVTASVRPVMDCGFTGGALDVSGGCEDDDSPFLNGVVALLKALGPSSLLHGLGSVAEMRQARSAGAVWASLDVVRSGWHLVHAGLAALREPVEV